MSDSRERVPYPPAWWRGRLFDEIQSTALEMSERPNTPPYISRMLKTLKDCEYLSGKQDHEGASFRSVAYAGRLYGLDDVQRQIETAEILGLTQHHVGHIIDRAEDAPPVRRLRPVPDKEDR